MRVDSQRGGGTVVADGVVGRSNGGGLEWRLALGALFMLDRWSKDGWEAGGKLVWKGFEVDSK